MTPNRTKTLEAPRKPPGAFFRWEADGAPVAVYFHMNLVNLLECDFSHSVTRGAAGVLLGRVEYGKKQILIVEDYESTPVLARLNGSNSEFAGHDVLEEMANRWHSRLEKRISLLGFYHTCPAGQPSLRSDDLRISGVHPTEAQQIILLIEPHVEKPSTATLHLIRHGVLAWKWQPVPFSRRDLTQKLVESRSANLELRQPAAQIQKVTTSNKLALDPVPTKQVKFSAAARWGLSIAGALMIAGIGVIPIRGTRFIQNLSGIFKGPEEPASLGLRLERVGSDWQLSWNRSAPVVLKASAGHLLIVDGFIHKRVDLDASELRNGSVLYTPVTDDVALRLEVVNEDSTTLANETARLVSGLTPSLPDPVPAIGGSSTGTNPSPGAMDSVGPARSAPTSLANPAPKKTAIALTMHPPSAKAGRELAISDSAVAVPASAAVLRDAGLPPSTVPAVPVLSSTVDRPAQLILKTDPAYPPIARKNGMTGTVEVRFRVNTKGAVENITVLKGSPIFAQAAVQAVQKWLYAPAQVNGVPTGTEMKATIIFKWD